MKKTDSLESRYGKNFRENLTLAGEDRIHVSCLGEVINMSFQWVSEQKDNDFEKTIDT